MLTRRFIPFCLSVLELGVADVRPFNDVGFKVH